MRLPIALTLGLLTSGLLLLYPAQAPAEIIKIFYLNSDLEFGPGDNYYSGHDREQPAGADDTTMPDGFLAYLGPLVRQTLLKNPTGAVLQSNYWYADGLFDFGTFTLPITSFGVWAPEPGLLLPIQSGPLVTDGGGDVYFTFGAGLLDAGLAKALGTSRRIAGGQGAADMIMAGTCNGRDYGDHLSLNRGACDGAVWIELTVPEPSLLGLLGIGGVAALRRIRRHG